MCVYVYTYTHTYIHTHVYIYIHIYIYIHTQICTALFICVCVCVYIYNGILLSIKRNEILPFATTWMDVESIIQSKIRQRKANTI